MGLHPSTLVDLMSPDLCEEAGDSNENVTV